MFFRNLTFFRFPSPLDVSALEAGMAECALRPVGPLELASRGFVSPFGRDSDVLVHRIENVLWLAVGEQTKVLPADVVNEALAQKLAEFEQREGRPAGGRMRKRMKEDVVHELLPRAFVRPSRTDAILDLDNGLCVVDSASRKAAEAVVSEIRRALGSFPALPVNAEVAPRSVLTGWIAGEAMPRGLDLGDECELKDAADRGAVVKVQRQEMLGDEITAHLEAGKQCTRLALSLDDRMTFVACEDLVLRKFKLLDGAIDSLEHVERDDLRAELDARFCLMAAEVRRLFGALAPAFHLSAA